MATIPTGGISPMDPGFGMIATGKSKDSTEKASDAFASLMNMGANQVEDGLDVTNLASKTDPAKELAPTTKSDVASDGDGASKYEKASAIKDSAVAAKLRDKTSKAEVTTTKEVSEADVEAVSAELRALLTDKMGITDEELDTVLSEAGLSIEMLLDPAVLKQFVLDYNQVSEIDLLVNENLANLTEDLLTGLQNLTESYDIQDVSSFIESFPKNTDVEGLVEEMPEMTEEPVEAVTYDTQEDTEISDLFANETVIKTEVTSTEGSSSSGFTGTKDHHTEAGTDHIAANLNQAVSDAVAPEAVNASSAAEGVSQAEIITQVIDEIKATMSREVTTLELLLNPEQLGHVHIQVSSKNGIMQAQIVAETEAAKNAIEQGLAALKETFETHELKVDAIEVMIADYEFFNQEQDADLPEKGNGRRDNRGGVTGGQTEEAPVEETDDEILMRTSGSSVSYTA